MSFDPSGLIDLAKEAHLYKFISLGVRSVWGVRCVPDMLPMTLL